MLSLFVVLCCLVILLLCCPVFVVLLLFFALFVMCFMLFAVVDSFSTGKLHLSIEILLFFTKKYQTTRSGAEESRSEAPSRVKARRRRTSELPHGASQPSCVTALVREASYFEICCSNSHFQQIMQVTGLWCNPGPRTFRSSVWSANRYTISTVTALFIGNGGPTKLERPGGAPLCVTALVCVTAAPAPQLNLND